MQINPIPYQEIAFHLYIPTTPAADIEKLHLTVQQLFYHGHFNPGDDLRIFPREILDRIITCLDESTALSLKITCMTFRCLVRENLHQEARQMVRFFDAASIYDLANVKTAKLNSSLTIALKEGAIQIAKRGDFERALEMACQVSTLDGYRRDDTFCHIALQQAFKGDLTASDDTLQRQGYKHTHLNSYVIIANELAQRGHDANAVQMANLIPISDLEHKLLAYQAIARAQVKRGSLDQAFETMDLLPPEQQPSVFEAINQENEWYVNRSPSRNKPNKIQGYKEKHSILTKIAIIKPKEGDLQATSSNVIYRYSDQLKKDMDNAEIAKAQIRNGDLKAALTTVNEMMQTDRLKPAIYTLIGKEQAKRGDFKNCLGTMNLIHSLFPRAQADQKVATVLYKMTSPITID